MMNIWLRRLRNWSMVLAIGSAIVLVRINVLPPRVALALGASLEIISLTIAGVRVLLAARRWRRATVAGSNIWLALEDALTLLVPRRVARLLAMEPRIWWCLWLWAFCRRQVRSSGYGYHKRSLLGIMLIAVLFSAPVEILLFEAIIPWHAVRFVLLALTIYSTFWFLGMYAAIVVLPHRLTPQGVQLRYGLFVDILIPYAHIVSVDVRRGRSQRQRDGLHIDATTETAYLAVDGQTDITIELEAPIPLINLGTATAQVAILNVATDEPQRLVADLRKQIDLIVAGVPELNLFPSVYQAG
ncbi:MAG TPA: hypothetical protein VKB76_18290 [Ktedonobacterales bacterium]|nr:hypothetical protein [Ktedonobacterales bacterium]